VARELEEFGVAEIEAHEEPPPFQPEMTRSISNLHSDPDPMTRMFAGGQQRSVLDAAHRGLVSDPGGTSFVPGLAARKDFGRQGVLQPGRPWTAADEAPGA
jgi:hypothetical protein